MTYDGTDADDDGVVEANVDNGSVDTGSLTDSTDGQAWETLREAGYETGDVLTLGPVVTPVSDNDSISSTTFTGSIQLGRGVLTTDLLDAPTSKLRWAMSGRIIAPSGETMTGRYYNQADGESLGLSYQTAAGADERFHTDWVAYEPTTTANSIEIQYQHKTESGGSGTSYQPRLYLGVEI